MIPNEAIEKKRAILATAYASEQVWQKNEKYVLFESYQRIPGRQYVWVTTKLSAFHNWPGAPKNIAYLRDKHRHVFHIRVQVDVRHADREVEFIQLKEKVENILVTQFGTSDSCKRDLGATSCEMLAQSIALFVSQLYKTPREIEVTVSEDGENGATIQW